MVGDACRRAERCSLATTRFPQLQQYLLEGVDVVPPQPCMATRIPGAPHVIPPVVPYVHRKRWLNPQQLACAPEDHRVRFLGFHLRQPRGGRIQQESSWGLPGRKSVKACREGLTCVLQCLRTGVFSFLGLAHKPSAGHVSPLLRPQGHRTIASSRVGAGWSGGGCQSWRRRLASVHKPHMRMEMQATHHPIKGGRETGTRGQPSVRQEMQKRALGGLHARHPLGPHLPPVETPSHCQTMIKLP